MYHQGGSLPLQGRPSSLPSAMDKQFQSRVDPRLLATQMPAQVMQQNGYQHPMYGGNMRQQQMQQQQHPITPQQIQQMSPQMRMKYQQMQSQFQAQQRQSQQMQMQRQAAAMASQQQQQMMARAAQMQNHQQQSGMQQHQFNPAMQPATGSMPATMYNPNVGKGSMGNPMVGSQPQFDSQGNPIIPDSLRAENTSMHGSGQKVDIGTYNQHEQYSQAKQDRNLNPKEHLLFVCPNRCKYSAAIIDYLKSNNLLKNFMIIDLADPRIQGIPEYITAVPTLYLPLKQRKFVEDNLKQWLISHFGNPTQSINGFRNGDKKASTQVTNMPGLRSLGDITGDGNDIFSAMTVQGAPLSNDPNKYEVAHTTVLEGSLSRFDDINKGVGNMANGGFVTPGDLRASDKGDTYDPNLQKLTPSEPQGNQPGQYIEGNPFAIDVSSSNAKNSRKDELQQRFAQLEAERAQDLKIRPNRQQRQQLNMNFQY